MLQSLRAARDRFKTRGDGVAERERRRLLSRWVLAEHALLAFGLLSGWAALVSESAAVSHARWLALKLGLVFFLVVPMEAMHALVAHAWTEPGLRREAAGVADKRLARGLGIEEMLRTLAIPLFGLGVPIILWLSSKRPF